MPKKISVVEINENTSYDDVVNHVVEEEKVEETQGEPAEQKEAPVSELTVKPKAKRAPRKKAEAVEEITPPTEPVRMKRTVSHVIEEEPVEEPVAEPAVKPKAKRAPRKKVEVVEEVVAEPVVEEPVAKPKAKRAPRKKAEVVSETAEETRPVEVPAVAPRKSRAAVKLELYEKLALNALP
jgi:ribonuclease E